MPTETTLTKREYFAIMILQSLIQVNNDSYLHDTNLTESDNQLIDKAIAMATELEYQLDQSSH